MTIEWIAETMSTGQPIIDGQHQEWIRRINEFNQAVADQKGIEAVRKALDFLTEYTEIHFSAEEALMERLNSPVKEANKAAHAEFRAKLAEIRAWVKLNGATTVEIVDLKMMLEEWLVDHICSIDAQLLVFA
jgi:hemerythrin-like metal-binding protein